MVRNHKAIEHTMEALRNLRGNPVRPDWKSKVRRELLLALRALYVDVIEEEEE